MIDTRTYEQKCKRHRGIAAPTPCLCCPDLCVGDRPGHSIAVIVSRAERRTWTTAIGAGVVASLLTFALTLFL